MNPVFPFPAISGQDDAKKALLCALASDEIRTVLITGDRGTAKSTPVRSISSLAERKIVLSVPQNVTDDRLLGTIDIETAISRGELRVTPGLMEQGNCQILSLLLDAYQKRDRIGLMIFRGTGASLLLSPTRSPDLAARMLRTIPTGGMTPLTAGLSEAHELLTRGRYAGAGENKSIVLMTDGRVNVPVKNKSPNAELAELAVDIDGCGIRFVVVDTEMGFPRLGRARNLAKNLEATYFQLEYLGSRGLAASVQNTIYNHG